MITVLAVGKLKKNWMREGVDEYVRRITPYEPVKVIEVKDEKAPATNSPAENEAVRKKEAERLLNYVKDDDTLIALDLKGSEMDSVKLADAIDDFFSRGRRKLIFVIGGSIGLSGQVLERADVRWRLSPNTFPHQLCRIIVLEQIYRAFTIRSHVPYHK